MKLLIVKLVYYLPGITIGASQLTSAWNRNKIQVRKNIEAQMHTQEEKIKKEGNMGVKIVLWIVRLHLSTPWQQDL